MNDPTIRNMTPTELLRWSYTTGAAIPLDRIEGIIEEFNAAAAEAVEELQDEIRGLEEELCDRDE